jgi:signal transduction histidine kinase
VTGERAHHLDGMSAQGTVTGRLGARWRRRLPSAARLASDPRTIAVIVAAGTLALGPPGSPFPVLLVLVLLAVTPWLATDLPRVPGWVVAATLPPTAVLFWQGDQFSGMFVMLLVIDVAANGRWLPIALALAAGLAIVVPPCAQHGSSAWAYWAGGLLISLFGGWAFHIQRQLQDQLAAARAELDRQAFLEERRRIAGDVHDLVAHSLTVVMLHLTAARLAVERDPAGAGATLAEAEQLGRQALAEVRRLVELLRRHESPQAAGPLPSVRDLPELVARLSAAGMAVQLDVEGDQAGLSPPAGLALFRIAQEALSNAGRHAPGARVEVRLRIGDGEARLSIRNWAPGAAFSRGSRAGAGHGLDGMRERAALLGGTLGAGPADPGWLVECVIPA